jgi:hypothetical protein
MPLNSLLILTIQKRCFINLQKGDWSEVEIDSEGNPTENRSTKKVQRILKSICMLAAIKVTR